MLKTNNMALRPDQLTSNKLDDKEFWTFLEQAVKFEKIKKWSTLLSGGKMKIKKI